MICSDKQLSLYFQVAFLYLSKVMGLLSIFVGLEEHGLFSWALAVLTTLRFITYTYFTSGEEELQLKLVWKLKLGWHWCACPFRKYQLSLAKPQVTVWPALGHWSFAKVLSDLTADCKRFQLEQPWLEREDLAVCSWCIQLALEGS